MLGRLTQQGMIQKKHIALEVTFLIA